MPALPDKPVRDANETQAAFQARYGKWEANAENNLEAFYRQWGFFDFTGNGMARSTPLGGALNGSPEVLRNWECTIADVQVKGWSTRILCRVYQNEEWVFRIEQNPYGQVSWDSGWTETLKIGDRLKLGRLVQGSFKAGKWYFAVEGLPELMGPLPTAKK
jgi:hypothetical protein